jgi:hypothetical protein
MIAAMPDRPIDVLRREVLAALNRAEQATAWEHRARAAEAALRELEHRRADAALLDDMAALLRTLRGPRTGIDDERPGVDAARIDELLKRYDASAPGREGRR